MTNATAPAEFQMKDGPLRPWGAERAVSRKCTNAVPTLDEPNQFHKAGPMKSKPATAFLQKPATLMKTGQYRRVLVRFDPKGTTLPEKNGPAGRVARPSSDRSPRGETLGVVHKHIYIESYRSSRLLAGTPPILAEQDQGDEAPEPPPNEWTPVVGSELVKTSIGGAVEHIRAVAMGPQTERRSVTLEPPVSVAAHR
jgi:hypothetical protein